MFLQEEVSFKIVEKEKIIKEIRRIKDELRSVISFIDWIHISNKFIESNKRAIKQVKGVQIYKLSELMGGKLQHDPKKVIHSFSSYKLSQTETSLLLKGLNFSLPPKKLKFENHLLPFQLLYKDVLQNDDNKDELLHLKSKIKDIGLSSFRLYNKKDHRFENLSKEEYEAFINLKKNKSIIIQKADKGSGVVIIDRMSFIVKMEELLSDRSKFMKVELNSKYKVNHEIRHLLDMEMEIKSCLDDLQNSNCLSEDDYKFMKPCGSKPGVMYRL